MTHTFYAKKDGEKASAGNGMLSPTTEAWLTFMMANPGGAYPSVLKNFQWGILNGCDQKVYTTRDVIFVQPNEKPWSKEEILAGFSTKVEDNFIKKIERKQEDTENAKRN